MRALNLFTAALRLRANLTGEEARSITTFLQASN
jgi:hypothetical protein